MSVKTNRAEYHRQYRQEHKAEKLEYDRQWRQGHREECAASSRRWCYNHGVRPMKDNKDCASFLGVHVAESVLSHVFKEIEVMPYGTPGYDFVCNSGKKIDVKSSCRHHSEKQADRWSFDIRRNHTTDYFLCLAFDDRDNLNPEHIWLIPGDDVNDHVNTTIGVNTVDRWIEYEQPIDKVREYCDILRGE